MKCFSFCAKNITKNNSSARCAIHPSFHILVGTSFQILSLFSYFTILFSFGLSASPS